MTPSKAILAGSVMIAAAILGSAALFRIPQTSAPADVHTPAMVSQPAPSTAPAERYAIARVQNGASWRLDRKTGEMTYCRVENDRMFCARSSQATELPKLSADALKAEQEQAKEREAQDNTAAFDRFASLFDRFLKFIERQTATPAPPNRPDGGPKSL